MSAGAPGDVAPAPAPEGDDGDPRLSRLLSQVLVAFTIEFDNTFEQRMPHTTARGPAAHSHAGPWLVSMPMWVNFLRFVDRDGTPLRDLEAEAAMTNLPGLERWGYVRVEPDPADRRADPPRRDHVVRPTRAGRRAQELWRPLAAEIEARWEHRFGRDPVDDLRSALRAVVSRFAAALPQSLPVHGVAKGEHGRWVPAGAGPPVDAGGDLPALLSQALLAFSIDFERESRLSLSLSANVLRVLTDEGVRVRDLPSLTGVSREAVSGSVNFLERHACLTIEPDPPGARTKVARLTPKGVHAREKYRRLLRDVEEAWRERFGRPEVDRLQASLTGLLAQRDGGGSRLALGLVPDPAGWRAHPPYLAQTKAVLADPAAALPHYPMVSHRGGFPDGS